MTPGEAPRHWTADVVLSDGGTARIRPVGPEDVQELSAFHRRLSNDTIHLRYFTAKPELPARVAQRSTTVDHVDQVVLIAELHGTIIGVASYSRCAERSAAEVAFTVADEHHGRGIGTILLEHLAAAAMDRGITRFLADTLPQNRKMLHVFRDAGFEAAATYEDGLAHIELALEQSDRSRIAIEGREHRSEAASVARLLAPRSVVVMGDCADPSSPAGRVVHNLREGGFEGAIHLVCPLDSTVRGVEVHSSVADIDGLVDLAVIALPAEQVQAAATACAESEVTTLLVLSAGFAESGSTGQRLQDELRDLTRRHGMRLVGPNCLGISRPQTGLHAVFDGPLPSPGSVAMVCQSWAVGVDLLLAASRLGIGISSFVSLGNKADISGNDLLQYWEDDPETETVLLHLEAFGNPRKFGRIARRVSRRKPIVAVATGRADPPAHTARSHTAGLATPDRSAAAFFRRSGVVPVETVDELLDVARVLESQPLPAGSGVAIVGTSGAPGTLASAACPTAGLEVVALSAATQAALDVLLDRTRSVSNPLDLVAPTDHRVYRRAVDIVLGDAMVDAAIVLCTPAPFVDADELVGELATVADDHGKPVIPCLVGWPAPPAGSTGPTVPAFSTPERAVRALAAVCSHAAWRRQPPGTSPCLQDFDPRGVRHVAETFLDRHRAPGWLPPALVDQLLIACGIRTLVTRHVSSADAAAAAAHEVGMPVTLEATGPGIVHRSEISGVRLGLPDGTEVAEAYRAMEASIGDRMTGARVQPMAGPGIETIIGVVQDRSFGPLVMFGLGGVATELLSDRIFRSLPLTTEDADSMIRSIRGAPILFGHGGSAPADTGALADLLLRVAGLAEVLPELDELDLDPVVAGPDAAVCVDARIHLTPTTDGRTQDVRRLS